jgi:chromosome segregation ATPase
LCDEPRANDPRRELDRVRQHFTESTKLFGVVAFAQTEALAQAERDVAEARARADDADALRKALASEQAANADLSARHEALAHQSRQTTEQLEATRNRAAQAEQLAAAHQAEIATLQGQVAELSAAATQAHARAQTAETRAKAAESNAAKLIRDIAELEKSRNELSLTLSRMTTDASDLRSMAENVSRRTEWIEAEIRKQAASAQPVRAELDAANVRILSLSDELKAALANAMTLSRELSAAKEQIHSHEKRAIELAAHAKTQANAASRADQRVAQLEAEQRDAKAQIAELRAELAETRTLGRNQRPIEPDLQTTQSAPPSATLLPAIPGSEVSDMRTRARRIEEDLRFERMHVQQLEQRLNSWSGLAGAMLRKITRFNTEPAPQRRQSARKRIKASTAPTRS